MKNVHFSSKTDNWATPDKVFAQINADFGPFTLDPCSDKDNAKTPKFFTKEDDGLAQDWGKHRVFMNPPYGKTIGAWIKKAYETAQNGGYVVCLVPARTDTKYWHEYCMKGEIWFIKGRISFGNSKTPAPFPSAIVVFRPPRRWRIKL